MYRLRFKPDKGAVYNPSGPPSWKKATRTSQISGPVVVACGLKCLCFEESAQLKSCAFESHPTTSASVFLASQIGNRLLLRANNQRYLRLNEESQEFEASAIAADENCLFDIAMYRGSFAVSLKGTPLKLDGGTQLSFYLQPEPENEPEKLTLQELERRAGRQLLPDEVCALYVADDNGQLNDALLEIRSKLTSRS